MAHTTGRYTGAFESQFEQDASRLNNLETKDASSFVQTLDRVVEDRFTSEHRIDGETIATAYAQMWANGIHTTVGEHVIAGQHIGDVGSSGHSTGPHLHFEVRPGGTNAEAVDAAKWLKDHDAADLPEATAGAGCSAMTGGLS